MLIKCKILCCVMILSITFIFSQEKKSATNTSILPTSIYALPTYILDFNSKYSLNKKLNLTSFKFVMLNFRDIEDGFFTISYQNLNRTPSKYIFETYKEVYLNTFIKQSLINEFDIVNKLSFAKK